MSKNNQSQEILELIIPDVLEGLELKITKNGILSATEYLKKTRNNKQLEEKFLIESILKLLYSFSKFNK